MLSKTLRKPLSTAPTFSSRMPGVSITQAPLARANISRAVVV
jgi:hypothetical protein